MKTAATSTQKAGISMAGIFRSRLFIAAAAATIVYKIATSKAPFPDNQHTKGPPRNKRIGSPLRTQE